MIRIPERVDKLISGHHYMLDSNTSDIRIRDYGSLNCTWINDLLIGWGDETKSVEQAAELAKDNFSGRDLCGGDRLKLGNYGTTSDCDCSRHSSG